MIGLRRSPSPRPRAVAVLLLLAAVPLVTNAQSPAPGKPPGPGVIALVDGVPIRQSEWDRLAPAYFKEVESEAGRKLTADELKQLRRNVLHELIRERLWIADARRHGMSVTGEQIDARMKQSAFFKTGGRVDEAKFQAFKRSPASNYVDLRGELELGLLVEQYQRWMERRFGPRDAEIRQAFRERTTQAVLRYLLVGPETVSTDPEATVQEIRAYYEAHPDEFQATAEARVQYVKVPIAAEGSAPDSAREAAAEAAVRSAKDLLAAINAGAPAETAAKLYGGFHDSGAFRIGDPIRGIGRSDALTEAVRAAESGAWLPQPIRVGPFVVVARVVEKKAARPIPFRDAVALAKRKADALRRDAHVDSLAREEVRLHPDAYRRPRLVAVTIARPMAAFEDPKPVPAKEVARALERARRAAGVSDTARAWVDSVRTALPAMLGAQRAEAAAVKVMREVARELERGEPAEKIAARRGASLSRFELYLGQPPEHVGLVEGAFLDSLYKLRPREVRGPRVARDSIFVVRVESIDPTFMPPYETVRSEARSEALLGRGRATEQEARVWFADRRERYVTPRRFVLDVVHFSKLHVDTTLVPEDSIVAYHQAHPLEFTDVARARIRHILIAAPASESARVKDAAKQKAMAVRERLVKGEDFAAVAREVSDDKASAVRGGDLGELIRSQLVPEFAAVAFSIPVGKVSEPVLTPYGYHLIRVDERVPQRLRPVEECRSEIRKLLAEEIADTLARRGAEALIEAAHDSTSFAALSGPAGGVHHFGPVGASERLGDLGEFPGLGEWVGPLDAGAISPTPLAATNGYLVARKVREVAPTRAEFAEVKDRVIADYQIYQRRGAAEALNARLRESAMRGAELDSIAILLGGWRVSKPFGRNGPIPDLARDATLGRDSLYLARIFSSKPGLALPPLQGSSGTLYARVESLSEPPPSDFAKRRDELRREMLEEREEAWTDRLRSRATVTIYRADLRGLER